MKPISDVLIQADAASLFQRGPFGKLLAYMPGGRAADRGLEHQAIALAVIAWLPLLLGTFAQDGFHYGAATSALAVDFGVHARYLVALPLLVLADHFCGSRLTAV